MIPLIKTMFHFTKAIANEWQRGGTRWKSNTKSHEQCIYYVARINGKKQKEMSSNCVAETTQREFTIG